MLLLPQLRLPFLLLLLLQLLQALLLLMMMLLGAYQRALPPPGYDARPGAVTAPLIRSTPSDAPEYHKTSHHTPCVLVDLPTQTPHALVYLHLPGCIPMCHNLPMPSTFLVAQCNLTTGQSESIPVMNGELVLGQWQE